MSLRLVALALLSLLALTGCRAASTQGDSGTPAPTDTFTSLPRVTTTANQVTVTTDRATYTPGDPVRVTIGNGLSVGIYAIAVKTTCTAVDVQVKAASGWQTANTAKCAVQTEPDTLEVKPGTAVIVRISAPTAGTYRCALQYTTVNIPPPRSAPNGIATSATNPASGPGVMVYSAEWQVKSV